MLSPYPDTQTPIDEQSPHLETIPAEADYRSQGEQSSLAYCFHRTPPTWVPI